MRGEGKARGSLRNTARLCACREYSVAYSQPGLDTDQSTWLSLFFFLLTSRVSSFRYHRVSALNRLTYFFLQPSSLCVLTKHRALGHNPSVVPREKREGQKWMCLKQNKWAWGCSSVGRMPVYTVPNTGSNQSTACRLVWWQMPVITAVGRWDRKIRSSRSSSGTQKT